MNNTIPNQTSYITMKQLKKETELMMTNTTPNLSWIY